MSRGFYFAAANQPILVRGWVRINVSREFAKQDAPRVFEDFGNSRAANFVVKRALIVAGLVGLKQPSGVPDVWSLASNDMV